MNAFFNPIEVNIHDKTKTPNKLTNANESNLKINKYVL